MERKAFHITDYAVCADRAELATAESLLAENEGNVPLMEWVAFLHYTCKNYGRSIELYERLLEMDPRNEAHMYYLANSYYQTGRRELAETWWRRVVQASPKSKFASKARKLLGASSPARQQDDRGARLAA